MSLTALRWYTLLAAGFVATSISSAQLPPLVTLTESSIERIQTSFPLANSWSCSADAVYSRAVGISNTTSELLRIDYRGNVKQMFAPVHNGDDRFSIEDFAVQKDGSLVVLALYLSNPHDSSKSVSTRLFNVNPSGSVTSDINLHPSAALPEAFRPQRVAVFSSGNLLVIGTYPSATYQIDKSLLWFAAEFDSNGLLIHQLRLDASHLAGNLEDSESTGLRQSAADWNHLIFLLNILPEHEASSLYILANTFSGTPPFAGYGTGLVVSSNGAVQSFTIQSPMGEELFAVAGGPDALFGMWGSRDRADDEIWFYPTLTTCIPLQDTRTAFMRNAISVNRS